MPTFGEYEWPPAESPQPASSDPMWPDWLRGILGQGQASQPAPAPAPEAPAAAPAAVESEEDRLARERDRIVDEQDDATHAANLARLQADAARLQAETALKQKELQQEDDPTRKRLLETQIAQAEQAILKSKAEMAREAQALSPQAQARLEHDLALQRQGQQQTFTSGENAANRQANLVTNLLNMAARREEVQGSQQIAVRGQEIDRLKAQDDWVLGMLRQQVAEGTLGLQKATSQFNAYVERARLPTQILESVAKSVEPLLPYMTARKEGESPPGFEKGGPMEGLVNRAGGSYDPKQYAVRPVKMDLFKLAEKAGANFKESGKVPDPGSHFSGIQTSFANPSQQSAVQSSALPPVPGPLPSLASGPSPTAAAEQGQSAMMPFGLGGPGPGLSMTEDERSRIAQMLEGAV